MDAGATPLDTAIPARLDRLPWSGFHRRVALALGITWLLDGLEVTIAGAIAPALQQSPRLHLTDIEVGLGGSGYVAGAVLGALFFGELTDRLGRKRLFTATLALYLVATTLTALSWDFASYAAFRFLTGAGIGGEYSAINSAVQEFMPARLRGRVDLAINGSFWIGAAMGAAASLLLLDPALFGRDIGWRFAFGIGAALGLGILYLRTFLPESPRWLMTHGRLAEAEAVVDGIESAVTVETGVTLAKCPPSIRLRPGVRTGFGVAARILFQRYPRRTVLGIVLMASQAFCYNAIFFTYALILTRFHGVEGSTVGLYILPFAIGNFLGPLLLGPLFDTIGRRAMISATYLLSGLLLLATGVFFAGGLLTALTQTVAWTAVFFFASAAASAAYLTIGESFPLEMRALAIALFYAFGTVAGGVGGPWLFGFLIASGSPGEIFVGYAIGAGLMIVAAAVEFKLGISAERRSLESVAPPLSTIGEDQDAPAPVVRRPERLS